MATTFIKFEDTPGYQLVKSRLEQIKAHTEGSVSPQEITELENKMKRLATIINQFNEKFAARGWIVTGTTGFRPEEVERALELARTKGLDEAEKFLVDWFNEKNLYQFVTYLWQVREFQPRIRYISLALDDYLSERYHSCIPLLLMMADGVVADALKTDKTFFSNGSNAVSWDSIAGLDSGLPRLKELFNRTSGVTKKGRLEIPNRNGILHGRELSYDNKFVAAKCWLLLFVIRDWLKDKQTEEQRKLKFEIESKKTIKDIQNEMDSLRRGLFQATYQEAFMRPDPIVGAEIPEFGVVGDYEVDTPWRRTVEFLNFWQSGNFGSMAKIFFTRDTISKLAGRLRAAMRGRSLENWKISKIRYQSACIAIVSVECEVRCDGYLNSATIEFRVGNYLKNSDDFRIDSMDDGEWKLLENLHDIRNIGTTVQAMLDMLSLDNDDSE